jgi:polar amino acid transport system substrate-binding protein
MTNTTKTLLSCAVITLIISFVGVRLFVPNSATKSGDLAQKVLANKEIRVGYIAYPPGLIKDPNTGQLSGIFYDALNEAGKKLGVKVTWAGETTWGTMLEDVNSGKFDMIGSPVWQSAARGTQVDFSRPLMYSVIAIFARPNDHRFDNSYDAINSPDVTISIIDGELAQSIAKEKFPKAKVLSLPQTADVSQNYLNVASGKADVVIEEIPTANDYLRNNPGSIRNVQPSNPLTINGNTMLIPQNQMAFKEMLNTALGEELNSGYIDTLIKKYETSKNSFYPPAKAFALPE